MGHPCLARVVLGRRALSFVHAHCLFRLWVPCAVHRVRPAADEPPAGRLPRQSGHRIADLFAAVKVFRESVSLTVIGGKVTANCPALDRELARHRWIPSLPHAQILDEMKSHDVFVFPSLFEGFGLVITEAMSQGTPVITTERTAGPDLITHGENGWLIRAGSTESLVQQLEILVKNPELVNAAGVQAGKTAAARPWSVYGRELAAAVVSKS